MDSVTGSMTGWPVMCDGQMRFLGECVERTVTEQTEESFTITETYKLRPLPQIEAETRRLT